MCTKTRAIELGCDSSKLDSYANNQLVQYEHLTGGYKDVYVEGLVRTTTNKGMNAPTDIRLYSPCLCYKLDNEVVGISIFTAISTSATGGEFYFPTGTYRAPKKC